jgi:hypothetical protein
LVVGDHLVGDLMAGIPAVDNKIGGIMVKIEEVVVDQGIIKITGTGLGIEIVGGKAAALAISVCYPKCTEFGPRQLESIPNSTNWTILLSSQPGQE